MEKLKALYESYIEQGLLSKETSFEQFSQSEPSMQEALYKQGVDEKIISSETTFDMFSSAWGEKKNQVVTPSDVVEEVTESTTETEITPGSLDSSDQTPIEIPIVEEEEEIVFDETTPENQELLLKNQSNIDLLNSVGYIEANEGVKSMISTEGLTDFDKERLESKEKTYRLKNNETGEFEYKKESEIKPEILEAISIYETSKDGSYKKNYTDVQVDVEDFDRDDVPDASKLDSLGINQEDYLKWDKVNTRQEGSVFKFIKNILLNDEYSDFEKEQRQYEKLQSYQATQLNGITNDLEKNQALQKLTSDPEQIKALKKEEKNLQKEFYRKVQTMSKSIDLFPKFKDATVDTELEKRKRLYYAVKEGGLSEASQGTIELLKTGGTTLSDFATNFLGGIPALIDQRLTTFGYDKKGFLAGLSDMFTDSAEHVDLAYGGVKRSGFMSGKPVTYRGEQYFVDKNGKVYDQETNILLDGIIPLSDIKEIQKRSKDVPEEETMWTGGSVVTGLTSTLVNLYGLIRTGGKVKNRLGLKGKRAGSIAMGITSFTSGVVDNVDDIRSQLMATGMSEKEAMNIAVNAGQAISTLDGVFSGLAGGNEKLLTGLTGIKNQIKNLAVTKGKDFTAKELKTKSYELIKENAKELFVEELPVLFSEKGINYLVNRSIGQNVLDSKITKENIIETAVMTIGATSGLGGRKLLSGNKRADLVRTVAADISDLQGTLDALVKEGSLTKKEASNAYTEIYSMQTAENLTKGTILVSENMETASDLLIQRQNLINSKEGLEGPGKQNIDNKIADVDAQLDALYKRDQQEAEDIVNETKTDKDAIQKPSTEKQVLQDDAGSKEEGGDSEVGLQQVREGDTQQVTTETKVEEGETKADTTSDTTTETDTEQVSILNKSINVTDSSGKKGLVPVSELESFVGENRLGDAAMPNSRETIDKLKEDIKKNGFKEPIVVLYDKFSNGGEATIIEGNHRYAAAKELGLKEIPVTFEKGTIRSNEKRAKDQMFPLNRKPIGKINDTFGVKGSDLGLTVRQPNDSDFVKDEGMSVNKERVDSIVDGIIQKTKDRSVKGEQTNPQKLADNAIEYLKGSKLFEQSTDTERETILRDVSKKLGVEIKAPTAKKLLGIKRIGKPTTIKVSSDYTALKKDLQKEAKIARDAKNDVNKRRKGLQGAIDAVLKAGNITTKKANSLLKKVSNVNLYNAKKVQDVIDFTERAMNDAEYSNKLDKAKKLQSSIKKKLKGKEAGLSDSAKRFSEVNPSNVADIDNYLEKASQVVDGLKPTRKPSKGDLKITKPFDINKIDEYSKNETKLEAKRNYELAKESFQELTGLESGDLTLDEMKEMMYEIDGKQITPEEKSKRLKEKAASIDKAVSNAFKNTKINIKGAIESGDIKVTKSQKTLINNFLNMDLSLMTTNQKMEALDSIINFELNQSTGGMQSLLKQQVGGVEMNRVKNRGVKSSEKSTSLGRLWNKYISTLPNAFELVMGSQQKARMVMNAMGLDGIINGSAKAQTEGVNVENDYANSFAKKKMQQGIYFDTLNDTERGILGEVRRFTPGTEAEQQKEFEDSKNLIKESYEALLKSNDKIQNKKGEAIKEQYEKLLKDSKTIAEVESKADPVNLQGVEYVTEMWAKKYPEVADVSLNVYNRNLGKDNNYTPRNFQNVTEAKETRDITEPLFNPSGQRKNAYDKETGVLKPATKPSTLPKNKVLNLSFDSQNMNNYKAALTDIYTASSIQQVKGARQSKAFNEVFTNEGSREIINQRINNYVDAKRGKNYIDKSQKRFLRRMNKVATLGVSRVLGGITQPIKQIVPIFNTSVNAGPVNTIKSIGLIFNKDVRDAIKNSGLPIANRGIQSQGDIEGVDTRMSKKASTNLGKAADMVDQINKKTLDIFLVAPDVVTAQTSFIAYYLDAMNKKGVKSNDIDFTKPLDKEAAQFAQQQVDRQQNTSDQDLQGELFTDQSPTKQILRKTLFPFANFLLNQKTRMYSDINTLSNKTSLPGDKTRAVKSLGGLAVETVAFNAIGLGITQMLSSIARSFSGEEEDDPNISSFKNRQKRKQAKEKQLKSRITGRLGNMLADVAVPVPVLNDVFLNKVNGLMGLFQEDEENPFKFFAKTDKDIIDQLGVLGIGVKKGDIIIDMIKTIKTGEFSGEAYGKKYSKKLDPKAIDRLKLVGVAYLMHSIGVPGLNTSEVGYVSERAFKNITKITEAKEKRYDIEEDAIDRLIERGIPNPSDAAIKREKKEIRRKAKAQQ